MADQRERDPNEIGALWKKNGARGEFFSGEIEVGGVKQRVVVFPVGRKASDKAPDYRVLRAQEQQR